MDATQQQQQRLGVSWVLRQAAILAVLALTALHLAGVTCLMSAQRQLALAADQAAAVAKLPRATLAGVQRQALDRLERAGIAANVSVSVNRQGAGLIGTLRSGDCVLVDVAAAGSPALPPLLARLTPWLAREEITAGAKMVVP